MWHVTSLPNKPVSWVVIAVLVLSLFLVSAALASSGGDYTLEWYTMDAGGGTSAGGDYILSGTIGQPDTGGMSAGIYSLSGGFWGRFAGWLYELFLPLIMR
jgi:hypothetical protein